MNRNVRRRALFAVATIFLVAAAGRSAVAAPDGLFRRGIGVAAMAWAAVEPAPSRAFVFPPFAGPSYALTQDELNTLRRTGFDSIRLAVDPGPFLQFKGARRDDLDRLLLDRVRMILAAGLAVVVDFHPSDMNPDYTARALTAGLQAPVFQDYLQMLRRTARLLALLHERRIALELMNEPPVAPQVWQPMLEAAYAAARGAAPDLPLVLDGGDEASVPALLQMQTERFARDPAVVYSFHYYEPYQFTHQGASWNPARYLTDVPYPARVRPLADPLAATTATIAATDLSAPRKAFAYADAQMRLMQYWNSGFDGATVMRDFKTVADWARSRGIAAGRIWLGEFGARKTALQSGGERARERAQWFHDVSAAAKAMGFGWSVWAYRGGGGFALAQSATRSEIESDVAAALGLTARIPRQSGERRASSAFAPAP